MTTSPRPTARARHRAGCTMPHAYATGRVGGRPSLRPVGTWRATHAWRSTPMSDTEPDANGRPQDRSRPTVNQPLNAPPRSRVRPVLLLLAFLAALALLAFLVFEVLVPAG